MRLLSPRFSSPLPPSPFKTSLALRPLFSLLRRPLAGRRSPVYKAMEGYTSQVAASKRRKQILRNPPPKRGQIKARILWSIGQSVVDLASKAALAVGGGSPLNSPTSSCPASVYSSDYSVDS